MKEYPVGTVCEIVKAPSYPKLLGAILTITEGLQECANLDEVWIGYRTDLICMGCPVCPPHECLRPVKFPPNADFTSFLNKITKPMSDEEMSKLRKEDVVKEQA